MEQTLLRRFTIDKATALYEKIGNKFWADRRRKKLNNTDFTIISNNCWGGSVYRRFGLPYKSPIVGMYFYTEEYIKLLLNLERNLYLPFRIISAHESRYSKELVKKGQKDVLIGVLGDEIEVVLLHYYDREEAVEKWKRRVERVNMENLIIKLSEMNLCTENHLYIFDKLPFEKKVLLIARHHDNLENAILVKRYIKDFEVSNDTLYYSQYLDLESLINA